MLLTQRSNRYHSGRKESPSFLKKKKQKTFEFLNAPIGANETQETKVFWFFFSKKNIFPSLLRIWPTG
jgi:hypothetical protein